MTTPRAVALLVSEIFRSLQGEGASAGAPCAFLRLGGCNLRCSWCDTPYTWDFGRYDRQTEVRSLSVEDVARALAELGEPRLVITGGEPLLQQPALAALLALVPGDVVVEVETNGTLLPDGALLARVNQWNVSPKLANSGEPSERRLVPAALAALRASGRAWLKLVLDTPDDLSEADGLLAELAWPRERVLFMPQAVDVATLHAKGTWVATASASRGVAASPRLHVERWGGARGR